MTADGNCNINYAPSKTETMFKDDIAIFVNGIPFERNFFSKDFVGRERKLKSFFDAEKNLNDNLAKLEKTLGGKRLDYKLGDEFFEKLNSDIEAAKSEKDNKKFKELLGRLDKKFNDAMRSKYLTESDIKKIDELNTQRGKIKNLEEKAKEYDTKLLSIKSLTVKHIKNITAFEKCRAELETANAELEKNLLHTGGEELVKAFEPYRQKNTPANTDDFKKKTVQILSKKITHRKTEKTQ